MILQGDVFLEIVQQRVDVTLTTAITNGNVSTKLSEGMAYSSIKGGKRLRAALVYAAAKACNPALQKLSSLHFPITLDALAGAVEAMHAYSLIHDDLPAMDDDDMRRGKPSNHIAYGEATAILAGDALQSLAFEMVATAAFSSSQVVKMLTVLAQAVGAKGMVAGQMLDMAAEGESIDISALESLHKHKTGALINASVQLGALSYSPVSTQQLVALQGFATAIGLAFQVQDDILDIESDSSVLGKPQGADLARNKSTYPTILGLDNSKLLAQKLLQTALQKLVVFGEASDLLAYLAKRMIDRKY